MDTLRSIPPIRTAVKKSEFDPGSQQIIRFIIPMEEHLERVGEIVATFEVRDLRAILRSPKNLINLGPREVNRLVEEIPLPSCRPDAELEREVDISVLQEDVANTVIMSGRLKEFTSLEGWIFQIASPDIVDRYRSEQAEEQMLQQEPMLSDKESFGSPTP